MVGIGELSTECLLAKPVRNSGIDALAEMIHLADQDAGVGIDQIMADLKTQLKNTARDWSPSIGHRARTSNIGTRGWMNPVQHGSRMRKLTDPAFCRQKQPSSFPPICTAALMPKRTLRLRLIFVCNRQ